MPPAPKKRRRSKESNSPPRWRLARAVPAALALLLPSLEQIAVGAFSLPMAFAPTPRIGAGTQESKIIPTADSCSLPIAQKRIGRLVLGASITLGTVGRLSGQGTRLHSSSAEASSGDGSETDMEPSDNRPPWAAGWMPTWLVTMRPAIQLLVGMGLYVMHLTVLTQHGVAFPVQLIPNDKGWFQSVGLDSLAGIVSMIGLIYLRKSTKDKLVPAVPPVWTNPTVKEAPWFFPRKKRKRKNSAPDVTGKELVQPGPRVTSVVGFVLLVVAYFFTGRFAIFWEDMLYAAAGMGAPMTIAMHRSLCVLMGHLTWIGFGSVILRIVLRPQPFFGGGGGGGKEGHEIHKTEGGKEITAEKKKKKKGQKARWYTSKWDTYWLWWTMGGYFVSSWLFNVADFVNQLMLPAEVFETAAEGVVSQLINPENNDLAASLVGYIAPCITAPWWEEVLYRGFMLPAMCLFMKFWPSVFLSGVVFSAHHLSTTGAIPLAVLGWTWAAVYAKSGNLLVTILIHAMWNSRVFLGSWLGL